MFTVKEILKRKTGDVFSATSETTVYDAIKLMSEKNIGALPVVDGDKLSGIFSERDYARKIVLLNRKSQETLVSEIMTPTVVTVSPNESIDDCMEKMSAKRIRHLPVMNDDKLVGIISIGDVVNAIIASQKETINHLHSYIAQ
ncbi:MAG: CBS domain-containing protein [Sphingobacteriales bacterium]|nr:MAG: CBS domain-containing protein [Sphingobacteriales bacterium]